MGSCLAGIAVSGAVGGAVSGAVGGAVGGAAPAPASASAVSVLAQTGASVDTLGDGILGCCLFCGVRISAAPRPDCLHNKRRKSLTNIRQFVLSRCQPTPYGHAAFSGMAGEGRVLLCIPCVNWQRRCSRGRVSARPLLLIDQLILFVLEPGKTPIPDQRCALRLVKSLRRGTDDWVTTMLTGLLPVPVQAILRSLPEGLFCEAGPPQLVTALVRAWWRYNDQTVFMSHHMTAKLVRRVAKAEDNQG